MISSLAGRCLFALAVLLETSALAHPSYDRIQRRAERHIARFTSADLLDPETWQRPTLFTTDGVDGRDDARCAERNFRPLGIFMHEDAQGRALWVDGRQLATRWVEPDQTATFTLHHRRLFALRPGTECARTTSVVDRNRVLLRLLVGAHGHVEWVLRWTIGPIGLGPIGRGLVLGPDGNVLHAIAYLAAPPAGPFGVRHFEDGLEPRRGPEVQFDAEGHLIAVTHWPGGHMTGAWFRATDDLTEAGHVRRGVPVGLWRCASGDQLTSGRYRAGIRYGPWPTQTSRDRSADTGPRGEHPHQWSLDLADRDPPSPCADEAVIRAWKPEWER
jgi:hypothetical protein